jgi:tripeptidyl-peptidase-1
VDRSWKIKPRVKPHSMKRDQSLNFHFIPLFTMARLSTLRLVGLSSCFILQALAAVVVEQLPGVPAGWSHTDTPSASSSIVLQVALSLQNVDQLESKLQSVSTPDSPSYGQYLDVDDIQSIFGASDESVSAVSDWLTSAGVTEFQTQGNSVWFKTNVATANSLLGTEFKTYTDSFGVSKLRTTQYSVPESVAEHIDVIAPSTYFGKTNAHRADSARRRITAYEPARKSRIDRRAPVPAECNKTLELDGEAYAVFDPDCLKTIYNIGDYKPEVKSGSKIAFGSFLNQSAGFADLAQYEKTFGFPLQNFSVVLVNPADGATDLPQPPDPANEGEANLDVQNIMSLVNPLPVSEFITAGSPPYFPNPTEPAGTPNENEPYLVYYEYLISQSNSKLPQVITNSYGDEEQTVPQDYATRVCTLIGLLGLRGISVLHSSGDEGVGAGCLSQDGKSPQFSPIFPATCPYVTSVGGTVNFGPEVAWVGSSGGFSNYFSRPWYQSVAIPSYLSKVSASTKSYYGKFTNFNGRGFPDIAAHSVHPDYQVVTGGVVTPSGGTSAASPVVASIIALLNDARLRKGLPALGFLNPLIYLYASSGFTDITSGQTEGCNGNDTQTGAPTPGVSNLPHDLLTTSNYFLGWSYPRCILERYRWLGSNNRVWCAQLWQAIKLASIDKREKNSKNVNNLIYTLNDLRPYLLYILS